MMKNWISSLKVLILGITLAVATNLLVLGAESTQAQGGSAEPLDTILARAAAKSFLTTLTRPELSGTRHFYLVDHYQLEPVLARLPDSPVVGFEVTTAGWVGDGTYQVRAILQPGDREIAVYTGKYGGRWRVEGIDLASETLATAVLDSEAGTAAITAGDGAGALTNNGPGKLVFQTQSGGDIYVINADGTGLRRVTHGLDPQLSPDGIQIAFTRWEPRYELFTINIDGTGERAWTHGWRQMKSPTWPADGSSLVFSWQDGGRLEAEPHQINLGKYARENEGESPQIPAEARGVEVKDGILRYTIPADAHWRLKRVELKTGHLIDVPTERHSYGPTGHPTQANLVAYKGQHGIALHNLETGTDQPVTQDFRDHTPVISPDGSQVAVSYWQDGHWEIHVMNIDGSHRQRLTQTPASVRASRTQLIKQVVAGKERFVPPETDPDWNNAGPVWSPDGNQLAFLTDRTGRWEIWLMNADGSEQRPMFPNGALDDMTLNYAGVDERMLSWR